MPSVIELVLTPLKVPDTFNVPDTLKVLPVPILSPTLLPVPFDAKIASSVSKSSLSEIPQVSSAAPGSGLVKLRLVVYVSAI